MSVSGLGLKPGESQDWSAGADSTSPGDRAQRGTVLRSGCSLLLPFPAHPCSRSWNWAESLGALQRGSCALTRTRTAAGARAASASVTP